MIFHIYLCGSTASQAGPKHERSFCVYRQRHNLHVVCVCGCVWVRGSEGCLYYTVLCCCVCWAICRAHRLFRIEVKCESALKPAVKSNKFAIVHSPQAINQQQLGALSIYIYPITDLWLMTMPLLCSAVFVGHLSCEMQTKCRAEQTESLSGQQLAK